MQTLVTGASRGVGRALCLEGVRRGHKMHAVVRKAEDAPPGCEVHLLADVRDRAAIKKLIHELAPQIDCFIINAGIGATLSVKDPTSADRAADIFDTNTTAVVYAAYLMAGEWARLGLKNRKIVPMASMAAGRGLPRNEAYIASKAALASFFVGFERNISRYGLQVNVILPGFIETDMTRELPHTPFQMKVDRAAQIIWRGLEKNQFWIAFPRSIVGLAWIRDRSPYFLFRAVVTLLQKRKLL